MNFSTRKAEQIKKVMLDPKADIPRNTYYMLRNIPFLSIGKQRFDLTIIPALKLGLEFNKTFGHIHQHNEPETYKLLLGKALFLLQKMQGLAKDKSQVLRPIPEPGSEELAGPPNEVANFSSRSEEKERALPCFAEALRPGEKRANVTDIRIIPAKQGDTVQIPSGWYHETINIGKLPLVLVNWIPEETENDYNLIEEMRGFGYYVMESNGSYKLKENNNYQAIPEPVFIEKPNNKFSPR